MKRLFLFVAVAALGITGTAQAQEAKFDEAAIIKKVEKLELDSQTPKRGARGQFLDRSGKCLPGSRDGCGYRTVSGTGSTDRAGSFPEA